MIRRLLCATALVSICLAANPAHAGDDLMVWRPATGVWYGAATAAGGAPAAPTATAWGSQAAGDVPLLADIDGDGAADPIVWRASNGTWYWLTSSSGYATASSHDKQWGNAALGDVPRIADVDGDGKADLVIWRATTGTWYWLTSSSGYGAGGSKQWGDRTLGDVPMVADFDGDGRSDLAVWRASTGVWYWLTSSSGYNYALAGSKKLGSQAAGDVPLPADLDGDARADLVVWRATTGTWQWLTSTTGYAASGSVQWGDVSLKDAPIVGDFDGDGRADLAVWRGSTGVWYWLTSSSQYAYTSSRSKPWGAPGDLPLAPAFFKRPAAPPPPPIPSPAPVPPATPAAGGTTLRLLQWNTHHGGVGTDNVYSPDRIATWAAQMQPDVITFNEIERNDYWGREDQPAVYTRLLEQKTGRTWYYTFAQEFGDWDAAGKGNLILSTYPFTSTNRYELVHNADRSIAAAAIVVNGRPITIISTHLDPYDQALRLTQATEVTAWSASLAENRIVTGDMNAWPDQTSIAEFNKTYFDSWSVAAASGTATAFAGNAGETKSGRIDYIFYSTGSGSLAVKSSQVCDTRDASGVMPSDHRPVLTTFIVR